MATAPDPLRLFDSLALGLDGAASPKEPLQRVREAARLVAKAHARLLRVVMTARRAGCSWRHIGTAAGIPYQSLHRKFSRHPVPTAAGQGNTPARPPQGEGK
jgi:hypothetical protein